MYIFVETLTIEIMREIKFRAWDNVNDNMELNIQYLYSLNEYFHKGKYDVMQFTGLKDENGVDIYEGDIIKLDDIITSITFDDGAFQMITSDNQGKSNAIQDRVKRFKIIGNIYENPELIK